MWNAGRQVFIAGHPRRTPFPNQVNINVNKQTYVNMAQPMFFPTGECCNNFEMSTLGKIGMGLGLGASILGGILGALDDGGGGGSSVQDNPTNSGLTPEQQELLESQKALIEALKEDTALLQKELDELKKQKNANAHQQSVEEVGNLKAQAAGVQQAEEVQQKPPEISAEMVKGKATTTPFKVEATKDPDSGSYSGHTGYNIVAGMYKGPDGKPLTHSEIMDLAREIFKGKALPIGEIQLPNEVTVNGKTYSINPEAKPEDVKKATYTLGQYETYKCEAQKEADHWVGTIDGQPIDGEYKTEEEAKAAAQKEAEKRAAEQQSE